MKQYVFVFAFFYIWNFSEAQNVAINTTGTAAAASAGLDVDFTNKGLLIPRVSLASNVDLMGNGSLATGLMVYKKDVVGWAAAIGYYYWDGSVWQPMLATTGGWALLGNTLTGTLPASPTEWLGTTNAADLIIKTGNSERARIKATGNFGINTGSTVNTTLDVSGSVAHREGTALALANGNNNDVAPGTTSFVRITGPTATYTITGFSGGADGRILTLYNTTSYPIVIANDASVSTAANRIYTLTGSNFQTGGGPGVITLQYNANVSRWLVVSRQDISSSSTSGTGPSLLYPDGTNYSATKFIDYGTASYTVPANTTLYILQIPLSGGMKLVIDGVVIAQANGASKTNAPGVNTFALSAPIVVGPGSVVMASTTADPGPYTSNGTPVYLSGFEITNSAITPVTSSFPSGSTYQVPATKTLVVLNIYEIIGATIAISSDNATWIPFLIGPSNYASIPASSPPTTAQHQIAQLLQPLLVPPGYYIRSSDANAYRGSFNGYLR